MTVMARAAPSLPDAVVVGAGPNGLAAAITIAREGHSVTVLERAQEVGGGARSAELTLPGFVHDVCSAVHPFGRTSPFFADTVLERHGLQWVEPPAAFAHPLDDGSAVIVTRDVDDTARQLGRDGDAYRRLVRPLVRRFGELIPDILSPFHIPLGPRRATRLAWFGFHALQPATWLARRVRDDAARAVFAGVAAHSVLRLDESISGAAALVMLGSAHHDGWPFPAASPHRPPPTGPCYYGLDTPIGILGERGLNAVYGDYRIRQLTASAHAPRVLEIGAGLGVAPRPAPA